MGTFSTNIKPTSSLLKKNMDLDFENFNFEVVNLNTVVEFKRDFNLNEVNDHSDLSDIEVNPEIEPYFDYESSMPIEDMMTALENNIIFSNNEPTPDNDNSFVNLANLDNICKTIDNTDYEEEYQPESTESCTSDEDFNSTSSDE